MVMEFLKTAALFEGYSDEELGKIAETLEVKEAERNQPIFEEGDEGEAMYFVMSGLVKIAKRDPRTGLLTTLNTIKPKDFFGEMALISGEKRFATAQAIFDSEVLVVSRSSVEKLLEAAPQAAARLLVRLSRSVVKRANETINELVGALNWDPEAQDSRYNPYYIMTNELEIRVNLPGDKSFSGKIERFGRGICDREMTIVSRGDRITIPYDKILYYSVAWPDEEKR